MKPSKSKGKQVYSAFKCIRSSRLRANDARLRSFHYFLLDALPSNEGKSERAAQVYFVGFFSFPTLPETSTYTVQSQIVPHVKAGWLST